MPPERDVSEMQSGYIFGDTCGIHAGYMYMYHILKAIASRVIKIHLDTCKMHMKNENMRKTCGIRICGTYYWWENSSS